MIDRTPATERRLTRAEEMDLARRAESGDYEARNELVLTHIFIARLNARRLAGRGLDEDDLFSEGLIGLIDAAERVQPRPDARFRSFAAFAVQSAMFRALHSYGSTIRKRSDVQALARRGERVRGQLAAELGRPPTLVEIADRIGGLGPSGPARLAAAMTSHHHIDAERHWASGLDALAIAPTADDDDPAEPRAEQLRKLTVAIERMKLHHPQAAAYIARYFGRRKALVSPRGLAVIVANLDVIKARRPAAHALIVEALAFLRAEVKTIA